MKKFFLFLLPALFAFSPESQTQNLPNASFESWTQQFYYSDPVNFWTTNFQAYFSGAGPTVTKTTDAYAGLYAVKLESVSVDSGILPGAIAIGSPGPGGFAGGFPFNEIPDTLSGFVKYSISPGDTGFLFVILSVNGSPIATGIYHFTGEQNAYTEFKVPINSFLPVQPDTLQFLAGTSQNFDNPPANNFIYLDELQFTGSLEPFPNGGFENWNDIASDEPDGGWFTSNLFNTPGDPGVTKTADAHSGNYAIRLENKPILFGPVGTFVIFGELGPNGPVGNFPLLNLPKKITGFYKYAPMGNDSSLFLTLFSKWNAATQVSDSIAGLRISLPPAANYTAFELPFDFDWPAQPDTMMFGFSPSFIDNDTSVSVIGSVLQVDELAIEFVSGVVARLDQYLTLINAFPNPAGDFLQLDFALANQTPLKIVIFDARGKEIKIFDAGVRNGSVSILLPTGDLRPGSYFYSIITERGEFTGKFISK
jgi:hypothetical protein